jgi:hypothetical protein
VRSTVFKGGKSVNGGAGGDAGQSGVAPIHAHEPAHAFKAGCSGDASGMRMVVTEIEQGRPIAVRGQECVEEQGRGVGIMGYAGSEVPGLAARAGEGKATSRNAVRLVFGEGTEERGAVGSEGLAVEGEVNFLGECRGGALFTGGTEPAGDGALIDKAEFPIDGASEIGGIEFDALDTEAVAVGEGIEQ